MAMHERCDTSDLLETGIGIGRTVEVIMMAAEEKEEIDTNIKFVTLLPHLSHLNWQKYDWLHWCR